MKNYVYTLMNMAIVYANSDKEFVEALNTISLKVNSIDLYMKEFSRAIKSTEGIIIQNTSAEIFVQDLKKYKLLSIELPN